MNDYINRLRKDAEQQQIKFISGGFTQSVVRTDDVLALISDHEELDRDHLNAVLETERLSRLLEEATTALEASRDVIKAASHELLTLRNSRDILHAKCSSMEKALIAQAEHLYLLQTTISTCSGSCRDPLDALDKQPEDE